MAYRHDMAVQRVAYLLACACADADESCGVAWRTGKECGRKHDLHARILLERVRAAHHIMYIYKNRRVDHYQHLAD